MNESGEVQTVDNLRVGKPDVRPDKPSHVKYVHQGNRTAMLKATRNKDLVLKPGDLGSTMAVAKDTRSTGINPKSRAPILPGMPKLTPP